MPGIPDVVGLFIGDTPILAGGGRQIKVVGTFQSQVQDFTIPTVDLDRAFIICHSQGINSTTGCTAQATLAELSFLNATTVRQTRNIAGSLITTFTVAEISDPDALREYSGSFGSGVATVDVTLTPPVADIGRTLVFVTGASASTQPQWSHVIRPTLTTASNLRLSRSGDLTATYRAFVVEL